MTFFNFCSFSKLDETSSGCNSIIEKHGGRKYADEHDEVWLFHLSDVI